MPPQGWNREEQRHLECTGLCLPCIQPGSAFRTRTPETSAAFDALAAPGIIVHDLCFARIRHHRKEIRQEATRQDKKNFRGKWNKSDAACSPMHESSYSRRRWERCSKVLRWPSASEVKVKHERKYLTRCKLRLKSFEMAFGFGSESETRKNIFDKI